MSAYLLALDQGTTSSRAIVFSRDGESLSVAQKEFTQLYPQPGWVEHDPEEIWNTQYNVARDAVARAGLGPADIAAIGITNQRETTVVWDRATGMPVYNAIVWQCRRTASYCDSIRTPELTEMIRRKTGLLLDPYFSATKLKWILDSVPGVRERAEKGELCFGTVDSWLIYRLTGGRVHATDFSNASRTMLFNIRELRWDGELLDFFGIPASVMPEVRPSSGLFGYTDPMLFGRPIPVCGVAGDQQAALFGQCCFGVGDVKNTYGTGGFMLMNTGSTPVFSENGLVTTIAWGLGGPGGSGVEYALEGSVFICGAAVQWLRDGVGFIRHSSECEQLAAGVPDSGGVYFVPAFVGLGAPYWDPYARGAMFGITRGTTRAHIARAVLEAMAHQTVDVISLMQSDSGISIGSLAVDGGASSNNLLLKIQADLLGRKIVRPSCIETTALGAARLAALGCGLIGSTEEIARTRRAGAEFLPSMSDGERERLRNGWKKAVERSMKWEC
jgi:glycerol kinase